MRMQNIRYFDIIKTQDKRDQYESIDQIIWSLDEYLVKIGDKGREGVKTRS